MTDWGDGDYELTAKALMPVAENVIVQADPEPGTTLLDVACGTGNALVLGAARGAEVTGIDLAPRLVEVARQKLATAELPGTVVTGDATELPFEDDSFDTVVSVFGVIFAPAEPAAQELRRVVRPHGRIVVTSWLPGGTIGKVGMTIGKALDAPPPPGDWKRWGDADDLGALLPGARITKHQLAFTAASPEAWLDEQADHHPLYLDARRELGDRWDGLRADLLAILTEGNEDPAAFRTTSEYWLADAEG